MATNCWILESNPNFSNHLSVIKPGTIIVPLYENMANYSIEN